MSTSDVIPITLDLGDINLDDDTDVQFETDPAPVSLLLKIQLFLKFHMIWVLIASLLLAVFLVLTQGGTSQIGIPGFRNADKASTSEQLPEEGEEQSVLQVVNDILDNNFSHTNAVAARPRNGLDQYDPEAIDIQVNAPEPDIVSAPPEELSAFARIIHTQAGYEYRINPIELRLNPGAEYERLIVTIGIEADERSAHHLLDASNNVSEHLNTIAAEADMKALGIFQILDTIRMQLKKRLMVSSPDLTIGRVHIHDFSVEKRRR